MKIIKIIALVLSAAVLYWGGLFLWEQREILGRLKDVPWWWWALPGLLYPATVAVKARSFDVLAAVFGVRKPFVDSLALMSWGLLMNYGLPGNSSIPLRSAYLQRILGVSFKQFIPLSLAAFAFSTGLYGVTAGVFTAIATLEQTAPPPNSYLIIMALFSGGGLLVILAMSIRYDWGGLAGAWVERILVNWRRLVASRPLFGEWLTLELLRAILEVALFFSIIRFLGIDLSIWETAVMTMVKECSIFFRLTPGAIGIAEGVQAYFATVYGVNPAEVVFAALVFRVIEILCLLILSVLFARPLMKRLFTENPVQRS